MTMGHRKTYSLPALEPEGNKNKNKHVDCRSNAGGYPLTRLPFVRVMSRQVDSSQGGRFLAGEVMAKGHNRTQP